METIEQIIKYMMVLLRILSEFTLLPVVTS